MRLDQDIALRVLTCSLREQYALAVFHLIQLVSDRLRVRHDRGRQQNDEDRESRRHCFALER